jgi:predicted CXXCH cytochrome family protein
MTRGNSLLSVAFVTLLLTLAVHANGLQSLSAPSASAEATADTQDLSAGDYLGSQSCARCHDAEHKQWKDSLHIKMTKPIAEATVVGDFRDGTRFADHDRSYVFGTKGGKPFVSVSFGGRPPETFTVDYMLGAKNYQGYLSTLPEGKIFVLPVFWHIATKRWLDWKEITPIPDGAHDIRQIWNSNCFNCHATNIVRGYDIDEKTFKSTWTEMGIGCEACHGPGKPHVTLMEAWEKDPASKPKYDNSANNKQLSALLKTFSTKSSEPRKVYDTCAYCHGNKKNTFVGFKGGDSYADYAMPFILSDPIPQDDLQGEFWPDGRPNRFNRPQALALSGCFKAGAISCASCHLSHGSPNAFSLKVNINHGRDGDQLCTQCHSTPKTANASFRGPSPSFTGDGLEAHTFHRADSAGSRCISCHMSDVNWRLLSRRRDHTFQAPVPENTAQFGIPNACTTCHDDRTPEWAVKQMDGWWGNEARRIKSAALAATMYRAGSGDGTALPDLARLAIDRSEGFVIRASAADYIGQLIAQSRSGTAVRRSVAQTQTSAERPSNDRGTPVERPSNDRGTPVERSSNVRRTPAVVTPAIVNALIGAANDPEPTVRAAAVESLGLVGDRERSVAPLLARLGDQSRVVRAKTAEVLANFGIVELPGAAGDRLRTAQNEYIAGLDTFPDVASNHAQKGWLESERGNVMVARDALNKATKVEPNYAFPWVIKGVLSAREGKFGEAVEMWKKARSIEPSYPNIDQLIAEAEKRK